MPVLTPKSNDKINDCITNCTICGYVEYCAKYKSETICKLCKSDLSSLITRLKITPEEAINRLKDMVKK